MNATTCPSPHRIAVARPAFEIAPAWRMVISAAGFAMTTLCLAALTRWIAGFAPDHPHIRDTAVLLHLSAVIPAVPLGAYVLLARKGTSLHKALGKAWVALMLATAISAIFVQTSGSFSWIHIFVPLVLQGCWQIVATARRGDMKGHRLQTIRLYVTALILPGVFTFLPERLLGTWLLG